MMGHLCLVGNKGNDTIATSGLVTLLAKYFDVDLAERLDIVPPLPLGYALLHNMRLLHRYHDVLYWALPSNDGVRLLCLPNVARITLENAAKWKVTVLLLILLIPD